MMDANMTVPGKQSGYRPAAAPEWLPPAVRWYVAHTEAGIPIRALARAAGCHASTVHRHIRRMEQKRDEPLCDSALDALGQSISFQNDKGESEDMTAIMRPNGTLADDAKVNREARRILRRLCENGAVLAIAADMEKAVVLKKAGGQTTRIAVLDRTVAEAFVLKDWISSDKPGRVASYRVTAAGRAALKRLLAQEDAGRQGFAEAQAPFGDQHRVWGEKNVMDDMTGSPRAMRYNLAESPLALLARRKDKNGQPFLTPDLVAAGERLREDFELAQMGPRVAQNWDRFLTSGDRGNFAGNGPADGARGARDRVASALRDLGPGLGDVVLRCCCYLEGMETAEKRMGWSARSGKIVLRIALQRLRQHYDALGSQADMIG